MCGGAHQVGRSFRVIFDRDAHAVIDGLRAIFASSKLWTCGPMIS